MSQRCSKRVFGGERNDFSGHSCGIPATVLENDKWWCKRHTKEGEARRRAKSDERVHQYIAESNNRIAHETEMQRRYHLFPKLLEALEVAWRHLHNNLHPRTPIMEECEIAGCPTIREAIEEARK